MTENIPTVHPSVLVSLANQCRGCQFAADAEAPTGQPTSRLRSTRIFRYPYRTREGRSRATRCRACARYCSRGTLIQHGDICPHVSAICGHIVAGTSDRQLVIFHSCICAFANRTKLTSSEHMTPHVFESLRFAHLEVPKKSALRNRTMRFLVNTSAGYRRTT